MTTSVSYSTTDRIGTILVDSPPVNALSHSVRQGLVDALNAAATDNTDITILRCAGRTFSPALTLQSSASRPKRLRSRLCLKHSSRIPNRLSPRSTGLRWEAG